MKAAFIYLLFAAMCVQAVAFSAALWSPELSTGAKVVGLFFTVVSYASAIRLWNTKP